MKKSKEVDGKTMQWVDEDDWAYPFTDKRHRCELEDCYTVVLDLCNVDKSGKLIINIIDGEPTVQVRWMGLKLTGVNLRQLSKYANIPLYRLKQFYIDGADKITSEERRLMIDGVAEMVKASPYTLVRLS